MEQEVIKARRVPLIEKELPHWQKQSRGGGALRNIFLGKRQEGAALRIVG